MSERAFDMKASVRLQAVKSLVRLQDPSDSENVVLDLLLNRMYDTSPQIRKEVIENIAVVSGILPKLIERVRDSDYNVRLAAFRKCSVIGPKMITIANRRLVVTSGFTEENEIVKRFFIEDMLPKWLSCYNGNYILLLKALKFDAFEEDLRETELLSKKVLDVFFQLHSLDTLIECLPIDETKLVPINALNNETALFWSILIELLRPSEDREDHITRVIPEMTHFCTYISNIYEAYKSKTVDWQYLEFQQILNELLKIVKEYDFGDEMGRQALQKLLNYILLDATLNVFVISEIILIMEKMNPSFDSLTIEICHIISDIREPLIEIPVSKDVITEYNFKKARLKVQINILKDECDHAVADSNYDKASKIKKKVIELNTELNELDQNALPTTQVKTRSSDPNIICRCLNIFIAILSHPRLTSLTASLRSCKEEFVTPLLSNNNFEIFSKAFKSVALCCLLDKQLFCDNLKLICSPIIAYKCLPHFQKSSLFSSISTFSDALRLFGTDVFENVVSSNNTRASENPKRRLNGTRRLFSTNQDDNDNGGSEMLTCEEIIEILLDMLDDENQDLREHSGRALCELVKSRIAVSSSLLSRLIIKWFNPITEKHDHKLQQLISHAIIFFSQYVKNSEDVLEKAVIPVLTSLGNAPSTSPLIDVNVDSVILFLSAITSIKKSKGFNNIHKNLAFDLCHKINSRPEDKCVFLYIKMLLGLELVLDDPVVVQELINQVELILQEITDKAPKRYLQKFICKLKESLSNIRTTVRIENEIEQKELEAPSLEQNEQVCNRTRSGEKQSINSHEKHNSPKDNDTINESNNETILCTIMEEELKTNSLCDDDTLQYPMSSTMIPNSASSRVLRSTKLSFLPLRKNNLIQETLEEEIHTSVSRNILMSFNKESFNKTNKTFQSNTVKRRKCRGRNKKQTIQNKECDVNQDSDNYNEDDMTIQCSTSSSSNTSTDSTQLTKNFRRCIVSDTSSDSEYVSKLKVELWLKTSLI
ncbi:hypothetical protein FQA39_LY03238 [Lamprigera yunnana]|nr:hypothetical protein FQA39_LY03238 [Lamprigera yunnana]